MATMDKLNRELGRGTIQLGLPRAGNAWGLRSEHRTPRYTTRWDELVNVKLKAVALLMKKLRMMSKPK